MRSWTRPDGRTFVLGAPDPELPAGELFAFADEADTERRAALAALGFRPHRRELELLLPTGVESAELPAGIRVLHGDEVRVEELRLLDDALRGDVPGTEGWRWDGDGFREETFSEHFDPALYLVAADEATGELVGIVRIWNRPDGPKLGLVGVRRAYRRRGITRALLARAFATLRERGVAEVETSVDETNVASRALLEALGGAPVGATLELRRPA